MQPNDEARMISDANQRIARIPRLARPFIRERVSDYARDVPQYLMQYTVGEIVTTLLRAEADGRLKRLK